MKRNTIGLNPLDALLNQPKAKLPESVTASGTNGSNGTAGTKGNNERVGTNGDIGTKEIPGTMLHVPPASPRVPTETRQAKERLTVHLPAELIDRIKDVVYWTPGLTLAALAEAALDQAVRQHEGTRGSTFPKRERELKTGRPISRATA